MQPISTFNIDQFELATDVATPATALAPEHDFLTLTVRAFGGNAAPIRAITAEGEQLLLPEQSVNTPKVELGQWTFMADSHGDSVVVSGTRHMGQ